MPCRPRSPILGHSSRGNRSVLSISAAIGATSAEAKRWIWSRSASAVSPRPKSKGGIALVIMAWGLALDARLSERRRGECQHADECREMHPWPHASQDKPSTLRARTDIGRPPEGTTIRRERAPAKHPPSGGAAENRGRRAAHLLAEP